MEEQIKELTLLLIYFTSWTEKDPFGYEYQRAWKGYDFGILNALEDEEIIGGSSHRSKSTYLTETGVKKAKELIKKYNIDVK